MFRQALAYTIEASPVSVAFDSLAEGYTLPDAKTVMVTNTGKQSVSLYQPMAAYYTLGMLSRTVLTPTDHLKKPWEILESRFPIRLAYRRPHKGRLRLRSLQSQIEKQRHVR